MANRTLSFLLLAILAASPCLARVKLTLQATDEANKASEKRINALLNIDCKNDVLKAFGIKLGEPRKKAIASDFGELEYCRKNRATCCNAAELEATIPRYYTSFKAMLKMMEPIEEMTTLFRGKKFAEEVLEVLTPKNIEKKHCEKYTVLPNNLGSLSFTASDPEMTNLFSEMTSLLTEGEFYTKRQGWFYGNLICTICNPEERST